MTENKTGKIDSLVRAARERKLHLSTADKLLHQVGAALLLARLNTVDRNDTDRKEKTTPPSE